MNIFVTNECPIKSARYLDDKRVIKMILESAQMLSTAINLNGGMGLYKSTHVNHPCSIWVRKTRGNYMWLVKHFIALNKEFKLRFNKDHSSYINSDYGCRFVSDSLCIPDGELQPFTNCARRLDLDIDFTNIADVPFAYRCYLTKRWELDKIKPKWFRQERTEDYINMWLYGG